MGVDSRIYSDEVESAALKILDNVSLPELVEALASAAYCRFVNAGAKSDFCVQYVGPNCILFGGTNRVKWDPFSGFQLEESHCTKNFIDRWKELGY